MSARTPNPTSRRSSGAAPRLDTTTFAPYAVHPAVHLDYDRQIPKKSDQRQMEPWQRLGVYAAGLALETAGAKADAALKGRMHLIVAAGGGERDYAVDGQILTGIRNAADPGVFLNERLMSDLRPTLFLAQLSNLLAGNISIVHGVTGASRTFMGEESAGLDAIRVAHARIAAGQGEIFLVGGAYNAERPDVLLMFELGGFLWKKPFRSVWDRAAEGGGFIPGSGAAFLVMEAREHAQRRGATPLAALAGVVSERTRRTPGALAAALARHWADARGERRRRRALRRDRGVAGERGRARLARRPGCGNDPRHRRPRRPYCGSPGAHRGGAGDGTVCSGGAAEAVVTSVGHWRGDGAIRLTRAE